MSGNVVGWLKDLLFPKFCVSCKQESDWLCETCLQAILNLKDYSSIDNQAVSNLDKITALFDYGENTVSKLIQMFKYNYLIELEDVFRKMIFASRLDFIIKDFVVMPVPLHPRRERERGFNQSEILANLFAEKLGLEINKDLHRAVYTKQQAKLSGVARRDNLKDVFVFRQIDKIVPEKVLLIDDVYTTGATMEECAKALKSVGVKVVWGLVMARG
ncbi:MAG: hypothetical protein A2534_01735 [Candidatus Magasanikbacteria bacterium RIFOXYD2_FULL_39_9]|uniref:Uncharacterized protein n=1 Tax=Candidatus Magasanikbacteria bacterium RIFOXYD1_FULL_40_23 TaxID=1798705 RepID=A0A1F6P9H1_9BACT|nr:MAG: hypothetical protein A2534_01735 [Candidatus Magasanikbacteria bacterium RIFOXYD2_FULL_39_9]OGH92819.1 MAG: hypothetical protein A2563_04080 [Candidatus Magasanikbacteria bacterium RIFOXYD1_FULL_40_23]